MSSEKDDNGSDVGITIIPLKSTHVELKDEGPNALHSQVPHGPNCMCCGKNLENDENIVTIDTYQAAHKRAQSGPARVSTHQYRAGYSSIDWGNKNKSIDLASLDPDDIPSC